MLFYQKVSVYCLLVQTGFSSWSIAFINTGFTGSTRSVFVDRHERKDMAVINTRSRITSSYYRNSQDEQKRKITRHEQKHASSLRLRFSSTCLKYRQLDPDSNDDDDVIQTQVDDEDSVDNYSLDTFMKLLQSPELSLTQSSQTQILNTITSIGFRSTQELYNFAKDFKDRPEALSCILQNDFNISVLLSHKLRAAFMQLILTYHPSNDTTSIVDNSTLNLNQEQSFITHQHDHHNHSNHIIDTSSKNTNYNQVNNSDKPLFKSVIVNPTAKQRRAQSSTGQTNFNNTINYGLPSDFHLIYPTLAKELDSFLDFMTLPQTNVLESPIRMATATVYIRHAKLFLGWYTLLNDIDYSNNHTVNRVSTTENINYSLSLLTDKGSICSDTGTVNSSQKNRNKNKNLSLFDIIPTTEAQSCQPIIDYILWLRKFRSISKSYEANLLRGLTKLLKFRFRYQTENNNVLTTTNATNINATSIDATDYSYKQSINKSIHTNMSDKYFQDIPAIRELQKLHRDANKLQLLSTRSSDEDMKWLSWEEYLNVVDSLKQDLEQEIQKMNDYERQCQLQQQRAQQRSKYTALEGAGTQGRNVNNSTTKTKSATTTTTTTASFYRRIAIKYQSYLILAFFSCVPDRQRTFRELIIGQTFIKDNKNDCYIIKHGPEDYKTGKIYGDRPPLILSSALTKFIDDYLIRFRPCLKPTGNHFFVQQRTGNAFSQDSVYSIVARACYKYTGKKTNPHLLRDMIVTHVRNSDASEKELEALALYMGHSLSMQRSSYDRRTMQQKVAPAVELLKSVNTKAMDK